MFSIRMKKHLLYIMFFVVTALVAVACKGQSTEEEVQQEPLFNSCSITPDNYVPTTTQNIRISYTLPISVADDSKITLKDSTDKQLSISVATQNRNLNITLNDTLVYNNKYTLTLASGAVKGANGGKLVTKPYSVSFFSEKKILSVGEFDIDSNLTNPNPSAEALALYDYLKNNFGKQTLSGAMARHTVQINEAEWMNTHTGKYPAIACFDFMNATRQEEYKNWDEPYTTLISNAKNWDANGGVVSIMWHWRDPLRENDAFYSMKTNNNPRTDFNVSKVHDSNSAEYKAIIKDIDYIAGYLKELQDAGIPILWRPLHEAQGGWFWWGAKKAEDAVALWNLMYDRLTNHHQLNNLIWIWTITQMEDADEWYPGHETVDIVGADVYQNNPQHNSYKAYFDFVKNVSEGRKIVALSECGSIPSAENMQKNGDHWSFFMPWNGDYTQDDAKNGASFLDELFDSEYVITRDEVNIN